MVPLPPGLDGFKGGEPSPAAPTPATSDWNSSNGWGGGWGSNNWSDYDTHKSAAAAVEEKRDDDTKTPQTQELNGGNQKEGYNSYGGHNNENNNPQQQQQGFYAQQENYTYGGHNNENNNPQQNQNFYAQHEKPVELGESKPWKEEEKEKADHHEAKSYYEEQIRQDTGGNDNYYMTSELNEAEKCVETLEVKNMTHENSVEDMLAAKEWVQLDLPRPVLDGVYAKGFLKPSKIQAVVLPQIIHPLSHNMVCQAQSGSGKTACFTVALLTTINPDDTIPQALILSPTRELTLQIQSVVTELGQFLNIVCKPILPHGEQISRDEGLRAHVVVGTPGKVADLAKKRLVNLDNVKVFVLDEADVMLDQENQMGSTVATIRKNFLPEVLQVLFFGATFPEKVQEFALRIVPNALSVSLRKEQLNVKTITHLYKEVKDDWEKYETLKNLYGCLNAGQSIIFVNSRVKAFELAKWMRNEDHAVSLICGTQTHGNVESMDPSLRDQVMGEFRSGKTKVLVATDVLSRGIDVPAVTLVINYQFPRMFDRAASYNDRAVCAETYIHRTGRTGRFGLHGIAVNLVDSSEKGLFDELIRDYKFNCDRLPDDLEMLEEKLRSLRK